MTEKSERYDEKHQYYEEHKNKIIERGKSYYRLHREEILAKMRNKPEIDGEAFALSVQRRHCQWCGKSITSGSPYRSYCSEQCYRDSFCVYKEMIG